MKTTLEIPDDLYRQVTVRAAYENRKMDDLVSEGLRLVLGRTTQTRPRRLRRMTKAPVTIRKGNVIPALSNDAMATLLLAPLTLALKTNTSYSGRHER